MVAWLELFEIFLKFINMVFDGLFIVYTSNNYERKWETSK